MTGENEVIEKLEKENFALKTEKRDLEEQVTRLTERVQLMDDQFKKVIDRERK